MENDIMVSICCIAYNQEKFIAQTIESFLMQKTNFKYEIIINDDASTDRTAEIIKEYENKYPHIKAICQTENQYSKGVMVSQIVRKASKGKYIAICEGDDYWTDENKLQMQVDFLEKNPEYIASAHWCEVVDKNGIVNNNYKNKDEIFNFKNKVYTLKDYKKDIIPGHVNSIVQRNIYLDEKYDYSKLYKASKIVGDRTTYLILVLLGNIYIEDKVMSAYRFITDEGTSYSATTKGKNMFLGWFNYYSNLEKYVYDVMGVKLSLKRLKYKQLINAIFLSKKEPTLENKKAVKEIYKVVKKREWYLYLPIAFKNKVVEAVSKRI